MIPRVTKNLALSQEDLEYIRRVKPLSKGWKENYLVLVSASQGTLIVPQRSTVLRPSTSLSEPLSWLML